MAQKPAWAEAFELKKTPRSQAVLKAIHSGEQEEIRLRAAMMASVDEGVGMLFKSLEETGQLDDTFILFLGDNGYFFGEHGLGPERRFAYEEGIRSPFVVRYPRKIKAGMTIKPLVLALDIAPTLVALAGGKPGSRGAGPLAAAAPRAANDRLAQIVHGRVLQRERDAVAGRHDLQGGAHRHAQIHPLGQPRRRRRHDRRALRPRRAIRTSCATSTTSRRARRSATPSGGSWRRLVAEALGL